MSSVLQAFAVLAVIGGGIGGVAALISREPFLAGVLFMSGILYGALLAALSEILDRLRSIDMNTRRSTDAAERQLPVSERPLRRVQQSGNNQVDGVPVD